MSATTPPPFRPGIDRHEGQYILLCPEWSGSIRPFRCSVYFGGKLSADRLSVIDGVFIGATGGCTSLGRARIAAHKIVQANILKWRKTTTPEST